MKLASQAALYSLLIFPGCGHFLLKYYLTGVLLAGTACACLAVLLTRAITIAQNISDKILRAEMALDIEHIQQSIGTQFAANESQSLMIAIWLLLASWLLGSADAWRLGRKADASSCEVKPG